MSWVESIRTQSAAFSIILLKTRVFAKLFSTYPKHTKFYYPSLVTTSVKYQVLDNHQVLVCSLDSKNVYRLIALYIESSSYQPTTFLAPPSADEAVINSADTYPDVAGLPNQPAGYETIRGLPSFQLRWYTRLKKRVWKITAPILNSNHTLDFCSPRGHIERKSVTTALAPEWEISERIHTFHFERRLPNPWWRAKPRTIVLHKGWREQSTSPRHQALVCTPH